MKPVRQGTDKPIPSLSPAEPIYPGPKHPSPARQGAPPPPLDDPPLARPPRTAPSPAKPTNPNPGLRHPTKAVERRLTPRGFEFWERAFLAQLTLTRSVVDASSNADYALVEWLKMLAKVEQGGGPYR